jgi:hypothetical protein
MPAKRRKRTRKTRGGSVTPAKRTPTPAKAPKRPKRAKKPLKGKTPVKRKPAKAPAKAPKRKPAKAAAKAPKRPKPKPAKAPKRKPAKAPKRPAKAPKRAPAKASKRKPAKAPKRSERSQAAAKGWAKRRKRKRLLDAMADLEMKRADEDLADNVQPIGWKQHRQGVREIDGERWQQIALEFSEDEYQARRLEILEDLEIDLLTKGELYDYLSWAGEHFDVEISDMYRMYLGYPVGEAAAAAQ